MDVQGPGQAAPAWGQILPLQEEPEVGGSCWVMVAFPCGVSSELCLPSLTDFPPPWLWDPPSILLQCQPWGSTPLTQPRRRGTGRAAAGMEGSVLRLPW